MSHTSDELDTLPTGITSSESQYRRLYFRKDIVEEIDSNTAYEELRLIEERAVREMVYFGLEEYDLADAKEEFRAKDMNRLEQEIDQKLMIQLRNRHIDIIQ